MKGIVAILTYGFAMLLTTTGAPTMDSIHQLALTEGLTTLVSKVTEADLGYALFGNGPFTFFGPTNESFANLPESTMSAISDPDVLSQVLLYHVAPGSKDSSTLADEMCLDTLNGQQIRINLYPKDQDSFTVATVQCASIDLSRVDLMASNGLLHVIDSVMLPPSGTILEHLQANGFTTLVTAIEAAGLDTDVAGPGPLTLFAPTDEAFADLPEGSLDKLLNDVDALKGVLLLHVIQGTYCSAGLTTGQVTTLGGQDVKVNVSDVGVMVEEAAVILADISVTNGVVHAIDKVILP